MAQEFQAPPTSFPSSSAVATSNASSPDASRFLPILLILFAGSGCAALIYEIVWYQCCNWPSAPRPCRWASCWRPSWADCASAASRCRVCRLRRCASLADLRGAGSRDRPLRPPGAGRAAPDRPDLHRRRGERHAGHAAARPAGHRSACLPPTILMGASLPAIVALDRNARRAASPGGACSTAATRWARCSDACWPAFICCGSTTWRPPPTSAAAINFAVAAAELHDGRAPAGALRLERSRSRRTSAPCHAPGV